MFGSNRVGALLATVLVGLAALGLMAGCEDDEELAPSQELLERLFDAGFSIERDQVRARPVNQMLDYVTSECYRAYHHPTEMFFCFHHFKTGIKAREARVALDRRKWPQGRYWATEVSGRSLVLVDAQIKDRPVANKLIGFF